MESSELTTKEGYKQTDVGIIPEDWEVVDFGNIIDYIKGFAFRSKDYQSHGVRIIRVSDTSYDSIKDEDEIYIDDKKAGLYKRWMLKTDDLIFSTVGSKPPMYDSMVGKVIIVAKKNDGSMLNQNAVLIRTKDKKSYKQWLILNHFRTKRYLHFIETIFRGNANQASITLDDLFKFQIPLPKSTTEQQAIAEVLSDVDALLTSLDQFIAKKRNIKQGTMQLLLTGKKRLDGFSGDWETKKVGDICGKFLNGGTPPTQKIEYWKGTIPWITGADIVDQKITEIRRFITKEAVINSSTNIIEKGNLLLVTRTGVGKMTIAPFGTAISQDITGVYTKETIASVDYLFRYLDFNSAQLQSLNQGTSIAGITRETLTDTDIFLPPTIEEQKAIAEVLSDMDAEIEALENKRDKYKAIKQGMMQELLTGKTRLV